MTPRIVYWIGETGDVTTITELGMNAGMTVDVGTIVNMILDRVTIVDMTTDVEMTIRGVNQDISFAGSPLMVITEVHSDLGVTLVRLIGNRGTRNRND
jgi:predicted LPLAT superfamily acyltransferase